MSQASKNFCKLYLVRHGETEWNKNHIIMGHADSPLTERGVSQAQTTAQELRDVRFDAVFSSDLLRTQRTAEIIILERKLAVQTSRALRERAYGRFEGRPSAEFREAFRQLLDGMQQLPEREQRELKLADDIESDEEVIGRFITQLREIAVAYHGQTVLVVTHGGCLRTFLMHAGYVPYGGLPPGSFSNAGYVKVLCDGVDFFIKDVKGVTLKNSL